MGSELLVPGLASPGVGWRGRKSDPVGSWFGSFRSWPAHPRRTREPPRKISVADHGSRCHLAGEGTGHASFHGLIRSIPVSWKSVVLRGANAAPMARQMAAICASAMPMGRPSVPCGTRSRRIGWRPVRQRPGPGPGSRRRAARERPQPVPSSGVHPAAVRRRRAARPR